MWNTTENPNEETIKCVVVGDNNVGKTRLICARAYKNMTVNKSNFYKTSHEPTVWAIDQYRNNTEVLNNARCIIDGTVVSLRLWDTFGDHHKDRRFAYGKADVVIICFSVCDQKSLQNVTKFWMPEVRRHSKTIPVILVACKVDLRYTDLMVLNKHRGIMSREIKKNDIVFPDQCRVVTQQLNCPYYESSVLEGFGVYDMFENVCRAALLYRKNLYIWNSGLKRIQRPKLQHPLAPPKPVAPDLGISENGQVLLPNLLGLYNDQLLCDVTFVCQGETLRAHKVILAASSDVFLEMFTAANSSLCKNNSSHAMRTLCDVTNDIKSAADTATPPKRKLSGPGCLSEITFSWNENRDVFKIDAPAKTLQILLSFCYTGTVVCLGRSKHERNTVPVDNVLTELMLLGQVCGLDVLVKQCAALMNADLLDADGTAAQTFLKSRTERLSKLFLYQYPFADVLFRTDDGTLLGHKVLLAAGSDMMKAMFSGKFIESENKEVVLPDTSIQTVQTIFKYIYTSKISRVEDCLNIAELIAMANQLCLPNLVSQLESMVAKMFINKEHDSLKENDNSFIKLTALLEDVIHTLCTSQLHNAPRLTDYCLHFLFVHYNDACKLAPKSLKKLMPETQDYICMNRWPPVWYIKQKDYYDKSLSSRTLEDNRNKKTGKVNNYKY